MCVSYILCLLSLSIYVYTLMPPCGSPLCEQWFGSAEIRWSRRSCSWKISHLKISLKRFTFYRIHQNYFQVKRRKTKTKTTRTRGESGWWSGVRSQEQEEWRFLSPPFNLEIVVLSFFRYANWGSINYHCFTHTHTLHANSSNQSTNTREKER